MPCSALAAATFTSSEQQMVLKAQQDAQRSLNQGLTSLPPHVSNCADLIRGTALPDGHATAGQARPGRDRTYTALSEPDGLQALSSPFNNELLSHDIWQHDTPSILQRIQGTPIALAAGCSL